MILNSKTWALVANGERATVICNLGMGEDQCFRNFHSKQVKISDLLSDKASRTFASKGKSRSGMEPHSDPVRHQERKFVDQLVEYLLDNFDKGYIGVLHVIAAPDTLGDLRQAFAPRLRECIELEIDKDLTQLNDKDLKNVLLDEIKNAAVSSL